MGRHTITKLTKVKETILKVAGPGVQGDSNGENDVRGIGVKQKRQKVFNSNTRFWKIIV